MLLSSNYREEKEAALTLSTCGEGDRNTPCHHITRAAFLSALDGLAREGEPTQGLISLDKHQSRVSERFSRATFHFPDPTFAIGHRYTLGTVPLGRQQQTAHDLLNIAIFFKKSLARWSISFTRDKADAENRKQVV